MEPYQGGPVFTLYGVELGHRLWALLYARHEEHCMQNTIAYQGSEVPWHDIGVELQALSNLKRPKIRAGVNSSRQSAKARGCTNTWS